MPSIITITPPPPFFYFLKNHLSSHLNEPLSDADASAIEVHIASLFGKDLAIARRNEVDRKAKMKLITATDSNASMNEVRRDPLFSAHRKSSASSATIYSPYSSTATWQNPPEVIEDVVDDDDAYSPPAPLDLRVGSRRYDVISSSSSTTHLGASVAETEAEIRSSSSSSRPPAPPPSPEQQQQQQQQQQQRRRQSILGICRKDAMDSQGLLQGGCGHVDASELALTTVVLVERGEPYESAAAVDAVYNVSNHNGSGINATCHNNVASTPPPPKRHVTFSPSTRDRREDEEPEEDAAACRQRPRPGSELDVADVVISTSDGEEKLGGGGHSRSGPAERPVDLFENWAELFGESAILPLNGKSSKLSCLVSSCFILSCLVWYCLVLTFLFISSLAS